MGARRMRETSTGKEGPPAPPTRLAVDDHSRHGGARGAVLAQPARLEDTGRGAAGCCLPDTCPGQVKDIAT